jgi:hypothetical protein
MIRLKGQNDRNQLELESGLEKDILLNIVCETVFQRTFRVK